MFPICLTQIRCLLTIFQEDRSRNRANTAFQPTLNIVYPNGSLCKINTIAPFKKFYFKDILFTHQEKGNTESMLKSKPPPIYHKIHDIKTQRLQLSRLTLLETTHLFGISKNIFVITYDYTFWVRHDNNQKRWDWYYFSFISQLCGEKTTVNKTMKNQR
jgi:hypothetical protein